MDWQTLKPSEVAGNGTFLMEAVKLILKSHANDIYAVYNVEVKSHFYNNIIIY